MVCGNVVTSSAAQMIQKQYGIAYGQAYQWVKNNKKTILTTITTSDVIDWERFNKVALELWETQNG